MIDKIDLITGFNLFAFARFNLAVDANPALGDCLLGVAATVGEAFKF